MFFLSRPHLTVAELFLSFWRDASGAGSADDVEAVRAARGCSGQWERRLGRRLQLGSVMLNQYTLDQINTVTFPFVALAKLNTNMT